MGFTFTKPRNLKMSDELYQLLGNAFDAFLAHWVGQGKTYYVDQAIIRAIDSKTIRWSLFYAIDHDLRFDSTDQVYTIPSSPFGETSLPTRNLISAKAQILPYNPRYTTLRMCCDLTTGDIDNALKAIFREFQKDLDEATD